ncbi:hypothetical protein OC25_26610, partial [Pedobacter kyungheensis]
SRQASAHTTRLRNDDQGRELQTSFDSAQDDKLTTGIPCTLLSGIGDFRRKKHEKLCNSFHTSTAQGRSKRVRWNEREQAHSNCRKLGFRSFLQERIQALIFCYFWIKPKVRAVRRLAAARLREGEIK